MGLNTLTYAVTQCDHRSHPVVELLYIGLCRTRSQREKQLSSDSSTASAATTASRPYMSITCLDQPTKHPVHPVHDSAPPSPGATRLLATSTAERRGTTRNPPALGTDRLNPSLSSQSARPAEKLRRSKGAEQVVLRVPVLSVTPYRCARCFCWCERVCVTQFEGHFGAKAKISHGGHLFYTKQ